MPADNVYATKVMLNDIKNNYRNDLSKVTVVSPDVGGVVRSRALAKFIDDADLAIIDKRRSADNVSEVMNIIGDVEGRECFMIDDIVDSAGTLCNASDALIKQGATKVYSYVTHLSLIHI